MIYWWIWCPFCSQPLEITVQRIDIGDSAALDGNLELQVELIHFGVLWGVSRGAGIAVPFTALQLWTLFPGAHVQLELIDVVSRARRRLEKLLFLAFFAVEALFASFLARYVPQFTCWTIFIFSVCVDAPAPFSMARLGHKAQFVVWLNIHELYWRIWRWTAVDAVGNRRDILDFIEHFEHALSDDLHLLELIAARDLID